MELQVSLIFKDACNMFQNADSHLTVVEDFDGVPIKKSSSPLGRRKRETKSSKWETPVQAPIVATSKWDNLDHESESNEPLRHKSRTKNDEDIFADLDSNKRSRSGGTVSDEDLDGAPLENSSPEATHHSSSSRY